MENVISQNKGHSKVSDKYSFISTDRVVQDLAYNGFELFNTQTANVRKPENAGFQKHLMRFRRSEDIGVSKYDKDNVIEIIGINSHMGNSPLKLMLGNFEFACLNGLITGTSFQEHKIYHRGYTTEKVDMACSRIISQVNELDYLRTRMTHKQLHRETQRDFASMALNDIFFKDGFDFNKFNHFHTVNNLIKPQREEDSHNTLWNIFNIVQEKFIVGCNDRTFQKGFLVKTNLERKQNNSIRAIDRNVSVNQRLFDLAENFLTN